MALEAGGHVGSDTMCPRKSRSIGTRTAISIAFVAVSVVVNGVAVTVALQCREHQRIRGRCDAPCCETSATAIVRTHSVSTV